MAERYALLNSVLILSQMLSKGKETFMRISRKYFHFRR